MIAYVHFDGYTEEYEQRDDGWYYNDRKVAGTSQQFESWLSQCEAEGIKVVRQTNKIVLASMYGKVISREPYRCGKLMCCNTYCLDCYPNNKSI